jgi:hypothetical protein
LQVASTALHVTPGKQQLSVSMMPNMTAISHDVTIEQLNVSSSCRDVKYTTGFGDLA